MAAADLVTHDGVVATIELGRLADPVALDGAALDALARALEGLEADASWRALVLRGGTSSFCVGLDLAALFASGRPARATLEAFAGVLARLAASARPVVALVEGPALGGGLGLAAVAHTVIATSAASFGAPELMFGMLPAMIAPHLIARLGLAPTRRLLLGTRTWDADEARAAGLVDELVVDARAGLRRTLQRLVRLHPAGLARTRAYLDEAARTLRDGGVAAASGRAVEVLDAWLGDPDLTREIAGYGLGDRPSWWPDA